MCENLENGISILRKQLTDHDMVCNYSNENVIV